MFTFLYSFDMHPYCRPSAHSPPLYPLFLSLTFPGASFPLHFLPLWAPLFVSNVRRVVAPKPPKCRLTRPSHAGMPAGHLQLCPPPLPPPILSSTLLSLPFVHPPLSRAFFSKSFLRSPPIWRCLSRQHGPISHRILYVSHHVTAAVSPRTCSWCAFGFP
ncbi:hypothetical protein B0H15DRAFT_825938 [Mycena belliarum]|uniref:Uncharacterized protein n=1 Tax=Mycena belliarum TaxID=1033014 RepID=A0AAD6UFB8_9AGAR|nr:hypothetical protein B0H15DRAFT_825938 [Mycena belliae]